MRRIIIITTSLLFSIFITACSKSGSLTNDDNRASASPAINNASTVSSGSGRTAARAIDDVAEAAQAEVKSPLPPPTGFVNDYANVIDEQTKKDLEATLKKLKEDSKIEFDVVTVETTGDQSSADYAMAIVRDWGIGSKDESGGGLLLLVAVKDRRWEVRWSRNLSADLENGTGEELERLMIEPFRQGKYGKGIAKGVDNVISKLSGRRGIPPRK